VASDSQLLATLRSDPELRTVAAFSLPSGETRAARVGVDADRPKKLRDSQRMHFNIRTLHVAQALFLTEFGVADHYEQIFIVDRSGHQLSRYEV